jgi:membrane protease YdiL (CAAX protease family)
MAKEPTKQPTDQVNWGPVSAILFVIVTYLVSAILSGFLVSFYPAIQGWNSSQANQWLNNSAVAQFWATVFLEALVVLFVYLFLKHRKSSFKAIGLKGRPKVIDVGYVVAGYAVYFVTLLIVVDLVHALVKSFNLNEKQNIGFSQSTSGPLLILVFISVVLLPPIVEEILFRGFLYTGLRKKLPKIVAAIITSVIFASAHLLEGSNGLLWEAAIDTFILSMVLVYLRDKTDKLWASMGLHMLKNLVAFAYLFVFHLS